MPSHTQADASAAEIAKIVGAPTFMANDFVIFQQMGALNVQRVASGSLEDAVGSSGTSSDAISVKVFAATLETGRPFQGPVTVMLKEYLPGSRRIGFNDLRLLSQMQVRWRCNVSSPCMALCHSLSSMLKVNLLVLFSLDTDRSI